MTPEKPLPCPCECGCGVLLAQRASRRGGVRRVFSRACEKRRRKSREADAAEDRRVRNLKRRLLYADAKAARLAL